MLETQISPIFGLTLIGLLELVAIAAIVGVGIATISLIITAISSRKQAKVKSAELLLQFLQRLRDDDFRITIRFIFDGTKSDNWNESLEIEKLLNHFEYIAALHKDGTLDMSQIREFFGSNLRMIDDNKTAQQVMNDIVERDSDIYKNLKSLLNKI